MAGLFQRLQRLVRHRWSEGLVSQAFTPTVLAQLERQVAASEALHSGQIRLCVEGGLPYSYIWRGATARERAMSLFGKLRVWDTEHNNGVLIYLLIADHAIEIVADRALHRAVDTSQWDAVLQAMQQDFRRDAYAQGMAAALQRVTDLLHTHFAASGEAAPSDANALPDAPVVQKRFFKNW